MPPFRLVRCLPLPLALAALTACSNGGSSGPDADLADATPTGPCVEFLAPSAILSSYPASHDGDVVGAGANHTVAEMACTSELTYWAPEGDELVVRLDALTPGTAYAVSLKSKADLSFYVTQGCTDGAIADGDCLLFTDAVGSGQELGDFTAPASGIAYVVVDHFLTSEPIADGTFTIDAYERECMVNADCTGDASRPFCDDLRCVACTTSFNCEDSALPVCDGDLNVCIAGHDQCTGDDPSPPESGDDGPSGATALVPTDMVPAVANAKICGLPNTGSDLIAHQDAEVDFYKFDLLADEKRGVSLTWSDQADDLDLYLFNSTGTILDVSFNGLGTESLVVADQDAGTYYLAVATFTQAAVIPAAAIDYTLTLALPECETSFDCASPTEPVCGPALRCEAPVDQCGTDDVNEPNDGPSNATGIASGAMTTGLICNTPATERDYYSINVVDGDSLDVALSYDVATNVDLDVAVFSADGTLLGTSFYLNPELVNLTYLAAGTYYIEVSYSGSPTALAHQYQLIATVTNSAGCTSAADCAAEYGTQIYRGSCQGGGQDNDGACIAIAGQGGIALGSPCDSGDDCSSGLCSNLIFQRGAEDSVCTIPCVADTTCTNAHGPGFSCTVPFTNNKCHPDCAGDLDCGAVTSFSPPDPGEAWDYLVCNAGACEVGM